MASQFSWDQVVKGEANECWLWAGDFNRWGYGICNHRGNLRSASRAAFLETHGVELDRAMVVCHSCDNRACCNPSHLFAGTQTENVADCIRKGRLNPARGAKHPRPGAKLSPELAALARSLYALNASQSSIARKLGVNRSTISRLVRGSAWVE